MTTPTKIIFNGITGEHEEVPLTGAELAEWEANESAKEGIKWLEVRAARFSKLVQCDWTQLADAPVSNKEAWNVYRQALRDITTQPDPFNIVWPEAPTTTPEG